jgi:hypothetical protein
MEYNDAFKSNYFYWLEWLLLVRHLQATFRPHITYVELIALNDYVKGTSYVLNIPLQLQLRSKRRADA